jgi:hypothetical protein
MSAAQKSNSPELSGDAWLRAIGDSLRRRERRPAGRGWMTKAEFCEAYDKTMCQADDILSDRATFDLFHGVVVDAKRGVLVRRVWFRPKVDSV